MQGPFDPQHPGQDAGAPQPEAQDGDLHALLERLLGQGDVRASAPGAGDDLWPDLLAATPVAEDVSTIVPTPDIPTAVAELPADVAEPAARVELAPARGWEPVVVDPATTTNVDDIHAAILASVSVEIEPIAPVAAAEPEPRPTIAFQPASAPIDLVDGFADVDAEPPADLAADIAADIDSEIEAQMASQTVDAPVFDHAAIEALLAETAAFDMAPTEWTGHQALEPVTEPAVDVSPEPAAEPVVDELVTDPVNHEAAAAFALTPFEAAEPEAPVEAHTEFEAASAPAVSELGLDVAPLFDLDALDVDADDEPVAATAVVLPWPSQEHKAAEKTTEPAPTAHDLIEAALSGLHADLTAEPVEPLRTPDVAVSTAHVVFRLGTRTMAIPLAAVSEIARPPKVTRLPHVPAWVLGIANLRGDIVSMLDLEGFFSGKTGKSSHEQRMLALRPAGDEVRTAVLVDSVDGIQAFEDARIARVTRGYDAEVAPYARGLYQLEDDLVVVVDADRLLQSKPMRQFEDGAGAR
jgi:chemotaxis signal transduction protein